MFIFVKKHGNYKYMIVLSSVINTGVKTIKLWLCRLNQVGLRFMSMPLLEQKTRSAKCFFIRYILLLRK